MIAADQRYWFLAGAPAAGAAPQGPATVAELHTALASGALTWECLVCAVGSTTWSKVRETPGLGPCAPPGAPPGVREAASEGPTHAITEGSGVTAEAPSSLPTAIPDAPKPASRNPFWATAAVFVAMFVLLTWVWPWARAKLPWSDESKRDKTTALLQAWSQDKLLPRDAWGRQVLGVPGYDGFGQAGTLLVSAGPDGKFGTPDDVWRRAYAGTQQEQMAAMYQIHQLYQGEEFRRRLEAPWEPRDGRWPPQFADALGTAGPGTPANP